jgi:pyruvate dehydrogenase E2 component (dihydrolipoamide acetyltransferase)
VTNEAKAVVMPLMGEGITEATLVKWRKKLGDRVEKDEPLIEVSTDKVDTEIASPFSGIIVKLLVAEGAVVPVNRTIAFVGASMDDVIPHLAEPPAKSSGSAAISRSVDAGRPRTHVSVSTTNTGAPLRSSPLVRSIAREMNLNVAAVQGSGMQGRITKRDVLEFLAKVRDDAGFSDEQESLKTQVIDGKEYLDGVVVQRTPMSKIRMLTAEHMVRSVRTSPHVTTTFEIDMHRMVEVREQYLDAVQKKHQLKLTYTHLISHAVIQTIKKHPLVNSSVDGNDILMKSDINLGVAVAIDSGLIVPVVKRSQELDLVGVGLAITDLATRARSKKLVPDDILGGTFSITNPGLFGSLHSNPIINQPQVAILSVGAIIKRPVVIAGDIAIRPLIQIGLTFDHRVIDGEGGAKFLADLKKEIEDYAPQVRV